MPITTKDLFDYFGLDEKEIDSIDKFKEKFTDEEGGYILSKDHKAALGKSTKITDSKITNVIKKYLPDFDMKLVEGKKADEKIEFFAEHQALQNKSVHDAIAAERDDLIKNKGKGADADAMKSWQEKYDKLQAKLTDTDGLLKSRNSEFDEYKVNTEKTIKDNTLNLLKKQIEGKAKFKSTITPIEKMGFEAMIGQKYKLDLDEHGSLYPMSSDGKRIPSAKKAGQFKTYDEVIEEEAITAKLWDMGGAKPEPKKQEINNAPNLTGVFKPGQRTAAPAAVAAENH